MLLATVVSRWGEPTQTFVRREAEAAQRAGHDVIALSIKPPREVGGPIAGRPIAVVHLHAAQVVWGVIQASVRHPRSAMTALARAVSRSGVRNLPATVAAWAIGVAWDARLPHIDWIQAHFASVGATAADALAEVRGQSFSIFAHAHDIFDRRLADGYTRDKLARAAFVLVEAPLIATEVRERFGCDAQVQRMGVPASAVIDDVPMPTGRRVVSVGSLVPKKGHDDLIRATARIDGCQLEIFGEGSHRQVLEQLAAGLGCADRVHLMGAVPAHDVPLRLAGAAVFGLASKPVASGDRDGVPNVLIEAMARGIPVVSTRVSGIPDLVTPDRGIVVEPGSVDALTTALRTCLDDPFSARARAQAALAHVQACYTTEQNWIQMEDRISDHGIG